MARKVFDRHDPAFLLDGTDDVACNAALVERIPAAFRHFAECDREPRVAKQLTGPRAPAGDQECLAPG